MTSSAQTAAAPADEVLWCWVLIETGSNQDFIFAVNKQAYQVGASYVVAQVGTWVRDAVEHLERSPVEAHGEVRLVLATSSKALLLVQEPRTGRRIVSAVTRKAVVETPGLDVWGVVTSQGFPIDRVEQGLAAVHREHALARSGRPSAAQRHPVLPVTELCAYSGRPASRLQEEVEGGQARPRGHAVDAVWRQARRGRRSMTALLGGPGSAADQDAEGAVVSPVLQDLTQEVANAGWVAVVHADGNGLGEVFQSMGDPGGYTGSGFLTAYTAFSQQLEQVSRAALRRAMEPFAERAGCILPLVAAGDDLTIVLDARIAVEVVAGYLDAFHELTQTGVVREVVQRTTGRDRLTAAAGIAVVKPHFPFHQAYDLAEQLCAVAKQVKVEAPGCSAWDVQVFHDTVASDLRAVRDHLSVVLPVDGADGGTTDLWAGPVVVPPREHGTTLPGWAEQRSHARFLDAVAGYGPRSDAPDGGPLLASSPAHDLRAALVRGGAAVTATRQRVVERSAAPDELGRYLEAHLVCAATGEGGAAERFSRVLTAMDVADVGVGRAAGERGAAGGSEARS